MRPRTSRRDAAVEARTPRAGAGERDTAKLRPREWVALADAENGVLETRGRNVRAVRFAHGIWTLVLDADSQGESTETRMRVRFRTRSPLRLRIRRHNIFTRFAKQLGLDDLIVPDPAIDRAFLIRTDNPSITRSLVLDRPFASALAQLPRGRLAAGPVRQWLRRVPGAGELIWSTSGAVKDIDVLARALRLMRTSADALQRLGVMREPL